MQLTPSKFTFTIKSISGMMLTFLKGWFLSWRFVAWTCLIYTIVPVLLIQFFVPESPPWLIAKDRIEEATKGLTWLHRKQPQPELRVS